MPLLHTLPSLPVSSPPKTIPHSLAVGKLNYHRNYHHNHHGHGLHNNHCHLHFPKEFPLNGNDELLNFLKIFSSPTTGSHWDAERGRGCPTWGGRFCGGGVFWIFIVKFCKGPFSDFFIGIFEVPFFGFLFQFFGGRDLLVFLDRRFCYLRAYLRIWGEVFDVSI